MIDEHEDGDGCAIYDSSSLVECDGTDVCVSDLEEGDVFKELGQYWVVNEIVKVGADDYHVDLESAGQS